ncbi:hypothetical protein [Marinifilum fragile]|uniref:hypothetical protein n=1 Tax=Marinifilum fragile TaxID=570161 RepID=UPI002AA87CD1|nr:hypothetical protein [Marinifilum fragile]
MKKILLALSLLVTLSCIIYSCDNDKVKIEEDEQIALSDYKSYEETLKSDLNSLAENLRIQKSNFTNREIVYQSTMEYYGKDSKDFIYFNDEFNSVKVKSGQNSIKLTVYQTKIVQDIENQLQESKSSEEFVAFLDKVFMDIYNDSSIEISEKETLLNYISTYKVSVEFIADNLDVIQIQNGTKSVKASWWSSWGKCASAMLGGATAGGIAGGELGLKVGTLLASPVKGMVIGAVVGAIGGAAGAAAAAC